MNARCSTLCATGLDTIPAMVELLYVDVRRELYKPARRSVLAHLVKLVDDGNVAVEGPRRPRLDATYHRLSEPSMSPVP